jgi:hypothetical protein
MELISFETTKVVDLFLAVRPEGKLYGPHAVKELVDRYKFIGAPRTLEELSAEKISFKQGLFENCTVDLDVYNDGIIVSSKSPSELLDAFIQDLLTWMNNLGLQRVETHAIHKIYESNIVVRSKSPILTLLDRLSPLQDLIARLFNKATNMNVNFEPIGFGLSPDLSTMAAFKPTPFRFERRAQLSFDTNYFYSMAPLPTADHLMVLRELEKLASD